MKYQSGCCNASPFKFAPRVLFVCVLPFPCDSREFLASYRVELISLIFSGI